MRNGRIMKVDNTFYEANKKLSEERKTTMKDATRIIANFWNNALSLSLSTKRKNKKGVMDIFQFLLFFVLAIVIIFILAITLRAMYIQQPFEQGSIADSLIDIGGTSFLQSIDKFFIFLFIGGILMMAVLGFFIGANPIFMVLALLVLIVEARLAGALSNGYQQMIIDGGETMTDVASVFVSTHYIMVHLPMFTIIGGLIAILIGYGVRRATTGGEMY